MEPRVRESQWLGAEWFWQRQIPGNGAVVPSPNGSRAGPIPAVRVACFERRAPGSRCDTAAAGSAPAGWPQPGPVAVPSWRIQRRVGRGRARGLGLGGGAGGCRLGGPAKPELRASRRCAGCSRRTCSWWPPGRCRAASARRCGGLAGWSPRCRSRGRDPVNGKLRERSGSTRRRSGRSPPADGAIGRALGERRRRRHSGLLHDGQAGPAAASPPRPGRHQRTEDSRGRVRHVGIGGVDAVVSDAVARSLGIPADNAIVISAPHAKLDPLMKQIQKLLPRGAAIAPLVAQQRPRPPPRRPGRRRFRARQGRWSRPEPRQGDRVLVGAESRLGCRTYGAATDRAS